MTALRIEIEMDGAAFEADRGGELRRIFDRLLAHLTEEEPSGRCFDSNGNTCGHWGVKP